MDQPTIPPTPATPNQPNRPTQDNLISPDKIYQAQPHVQVPASGKNLMNPVVIPEDHPYHFWKALLFETLAVIGAGSVGYAFVRYLAGGFSFWWVFAALLGWSAFSVIVGMIQKDIPRRMAFAFFEALALIIFFYSFAWGALLATGILTFLCIMWGYFSIRRELHSALEIRFFRASGAVIGKLVTAAAIFMIIMYGSLAHDNGSLFISQNTFNTFFNWAAELADKFYPNIPINGSFGDFAQTIAQEQLQNNPEFQKLPVAQKQQAVDSSAQQFMNGFTTSTNAASLPTSNVFYSYFSNLFSRWENEYSVIFIGGWSLLLFLILRSIGIIVVWAGEFVALVLYELLLAAGFMKISERPATKEVIDI